MLFSLALLPLVAHASPLERDSSSLSPEYPYVPVGTGTEAVVDLAVSRGSPGYFGTGMLNGIPENDPNQIPEKWFSGIKIQYARDGGGQDGAPNRGWLYGFDEYRGRLNLVLNVYKTMRKVGGKFILMGSDLWGASDEKDSFPGDNNSFEEYDKFWHQLMDDLVTYDVLDGMEIDIWNEPDFPEFWNRSMQQWVDTYNHVFNMTKADGRFNNVPLQGPTLQNFPEPNSTWWTTWLQQVEGNGTAPDIYSYHLLKGSRPHIRDPYVSNATLVSLLDTYSLPQNGVNVNEYGNKNDQTPSGYAWYISRFERYDMTGCMAVYNKPLALHDYMVGLVTKEHNVSDPNATDYIAAAGWPVFNYYAEMSGDRLETSSSTNLQFDAFATLDSDTKKVAILAGTSVVTGSYTLTVKNLDSVSGQAAGSINVTTSVYTGTTNHTAPATPVSHRGSKVYTYSNGTVSIPVVQVDSHAAWTFEFTV